MVKSKRSTKAKEKRSVYYRRRHCSSDVEIEWTEELDEKLFSLLKCYPSQWGTVANMVGCSASQCSERYEKLSDAFRATGGNYEPGDDPIKLRPVEIDPPVTVDMLSQARDRLAVTRAKKAKRTARQKKLELARRRLPTRINLRHIEIPDVQRPPLGYYDIADEDQPAELVKSPTAIEELEGERRVGKEARLRKKDIARSKVSKRQDAPSAILQENKLNDPEPVQKRSSLNLPAPRFPGVSSLTPKVRGKRLKNEDVDELSKQKVIYGLRNLPQPKNDYQIVIQPLAEEDGEPDEKVKEDMLAEEKARQQALLKKRSKVLQRGLPGPPVGLLDLLRNSLRDDEEKSSRVPKTSVQQADVLLRMELLSLLEYDNLKYPMDEKATKEKKGGKLAAKENSVDVPTIEEFEEDELKEAGDLLEQEVQFIREAVGLCKEYFDDYVDALTCLNDIMYLPTWGFGLASDPSNQDRLEFLQNQFENVKKKKDEVSEKAQHIEKKIEVYTKGYKWRFDTLRTQVEASFKQMYDAGIELESCQALFQQEKISAEYRVSNSLDEVQKLKELQLSLQNQHKGLLAELERVQHLFTQHESSTGDGEA